MRTQPRWFPLTDHDPMSDVALVATPDRRQTVIVKTTRIVGDIPPAPALTDLVDANYEEKLARALARDQAIRAAPIAPNTLPHAGERFIVNSPTELAILLRALARIGHRFPDYEAMMDELRALTRKKRL